MLIGSVGLNTIANQTAQDGYSAAHAASKEASRNLSVSNFGGSRMRWQLARAVVRRRRRCRRR